MIFRNVVFGACNKRRSSGYWQVWRDTNDGINGAYEYSRWVSFDAVVWC